VLLLPGQGKVEDGHDGAERRHHVQKEDQPGPAEHKFIYLKKTLQGQRKDTRRYVNIKKATETTSDENQNIVQKRDFYFILPCKQNFRQPMFENIRIWDDFIPNL
jgi:hypothetical protein